MNIDSRTPQTAGHGEKFSRKKEAALAALLTESTLSEAATKAGVSERTLRDWLGNPEFARDYRAARSALVEQAQTALQSNMGKAVTVLLQVAEDKTSPASARVSAARAVIDAGLKAYELGDLTQRLEDLEQTIASRSH